MYIYGKNVSIEALRNNKTIKKAYIYNNFKDEEILKQIKNKNIPIKRMEKKELDKIVDGNHQGIVLVVEDYEYCDIDDIIKDDDCLIIMLDHLEDPHNFGAIIRTCEAAGVDGIIIPKDRSVEVNSTVVKVSTGALEYVKIAQVTNLRNTLDYLKKKGFWIVGTDMVGTSYDEIDYTGKTCIVIGSESNGMSRIVKDACDFIASIPIYGKTNSLNASVAAGIIIYESIKKRR